MRIIKPNVEVMLQGRGIDGMMRHIEKCGRVCYRSEDKMTDDSAGRFINMLKNSAHTSVLEHGAVYLQIPYNKVVEEAFSRNPYSRVDSIPECGSLFVSTNYRVIVENHMEDMLKYMVEPGPMHELRLTFKFTTQIAIGREFNRHRVNSPSEESTRYCAYNKAKFGGQVAINQPTWIADEDVAMCQMRHEDSLFAMAHEFAEGGASQWFPIDTWWFVNSICEWGYLDLLKKGWKPQQARTVLPLDTNTTLVHTAFVSDWEHFLGLRADKAHAHPDAYYLASLLEQKLMKLNVIKPLNNQE